jgi:hypothetical protein
VFSILISPCWRFAAHHSDQAVLSRAFDPQFRRGQFLLGTSLLIAMYMPALFPQAFQNIDV